MPSKSKRPSPGQMDTPAEFFIKSTTDGELNRKITWTTAGKRMVQVIHRTTDEKDMANAYTGITKCYLKVVNESILRSSELKVEFYGKRWNVEGWEEIPGRLYILLNVVNTDAI